MKTLVMCILLGSSWLAVARNSVGVKAILQERWGLSRQHTEAYAEKVNQVLQERWGLSWQHIEAYVEGGRTSIPFFSKLLEDTGQVGEVLRQDFSKFTAGPSFWLYELGYPPTEQGKKGVANAVNELDALVDRLVVSDTQEVALQLLQQAQRLFTIEVAATRILQLEQSEVVIYGQQRELLKGVVALRNKARDAAQTNANATMDTWEKLHNYHQCSLIPFTTLLDSTCLDIKSLIYKGSLDNYRLLAYQRGEDVISEEEFAVLENAIQNLEKIALFKHTMDIITRNPNITQNVKTVRDKQRSDLELMRSSLRIEQEAKMLQERAVTLTPVQQELIAKVERLRGEALAQLANNVDSQAIKHYQEAQATSASLFADILTGLDISVAKLASTSGVSGKAIMAQQAGKERFNEEDAEQVIAALTQARDHLPAPSWWRQVCNSLGKNKTCLAAHKQHLSRLLADFAVALRVEQYLQDARHMAVE